MEVNRYREKRYCFFGISIALIISMALAILIPIISEAFERRYIQGNHYAILTQHLIDGYGKAHDLYIYDTSFRWRYFVDGKELGGPRTSFSLRSNSSEDVNFIVRVTDSWVSDSFHLVMWHRLNFYLQNLF